jgi:hypothetical protein
MTASTAVPVIIRRRPPEVIAARAHVILHAALAVCELWESSAPAATAARDLDAALDEHRCLKARHTSWEQVYPELSDAEDPHGEALDKSAEECALAAALLLMTIAATSGKEVADAIKDAAGEAS